MKKLILLLFCTFFLYFYSCKNNVVNDQSYVLQGTITDFNGNPLDSVIVGLKNPSVPDSMLYTPDSINFSYPNGFIWAMRTKQDGKYDWGQSLGHRDTSLYKEIFAFKTGYKLWRYLEHNSKVKKLSEFSDELYIELEHN